MSNYAKLLIFIVIFCVGFGAAILYLSWPLLTGETHVLATAPVDPFDLFKGQYLILSYEISQVPNTETLSEKAKDEEVYVVLEKDSLGISRPKETSLIKPEGKAFIKGKLKSINSNHIQIEYGIEQFFFERGAIFSMQNLTVEVKVDRSGQARISKLLQNGKPLEMEYRKASWTS